MGWRGAVRSLNAANNRAIRAREKAQHQIERQTEKINKKIGKISEQKDKVEESLKTELASGKISSAEYGSLLKRMEDITEELLVFGKAAGTTLGKRYVCGKIDKAEFEKLRAALVPAGLYQEKNLIESQIKKAQNDVEEFKKNCSAIPNACSKCKKPRKFFRWLKEEDGLLLCRKCRDKLADLKHYKGFDGLYIVTNPCEVRDQMRITISIRSTYL